MDRFDIPSCRILLKHKSPQCWVFPVFKSFPPDKRRAEKPPKISPQCTQCSIDFQVTLTPHSFVWLLLCKTLFSQDIPSMKLDQNNMKRLGEEKSFNPRLVNFGGFLWYIL